MHDQQNWDFRVQSSRYLNTWNTDNFLMIILMYNKNIDT